MQKENMQLLERLQKTEGLLQKARSGESIPEEPKSQTITLSAEVSEKLEDLDSRMDEIKRGLHQAKSECVKDLNGKFAEKLKTAQ